MLQRVSRVSLYVDEMTLYMSINGGGGGGGGGGLAYIYYSSCIHVSLVGNRFHGTTLCGVIKNSIAVLLCHVDDHKIALTVNKQWLNRII